MSTCGRWIAVLPHPLRRRRRRSTTPATPTRCAREVARLRAAATSRATNASCARARRSIASASSSSATCRSDRRPTCCASLPDLVRLEGYRSVYGLVAQSRARSAAAPGAELPSAARSAAIRSATTSIYCLIAFLERRWGVHFAMGGTGTLVRGPASVSSKGRAARSAATRRCERDHRARRRGRPACGSRRARRIAADIVVSNADSAWTYRHLVPAHVAQALDRPPARARALLDEPLRLVLRHAAAAIADVAHHTILLGPRYRELLADIFERKVLADDFSLYLHRPTATDPSLAPPGCDAFYVLSPVPHLDSGIDWADARGSAIAHAIARAARATAAAGPRASRSSRRAC